MVIKMEEIIREIVYICVMFIGIILYEVMSDKCLVCILDKPLFPVFIKKMEKRSYTGLDLQSYSYLYFQVFFYLLELHISK